jgi:hypothetical protein
VRDAVEAAALAIHRAAAHLLAEVRVLERVASRHQRLERSRDLIAQPFRPSGQRGLGDEGNRGRSERCPCFLSGEPLHLACAVDQRREGGQGGVVDGARDRLLYGSGSKAIMGTYWAQVLPYARPDSGSGVTISLTYGPKVGVDANGNVYVATTFAGTLQIVNCVPLASSGGASTTDIALATFTPTGDCLNAVDIGNGMGQTLDSIAVSPFGAVALAGQLQGTVTFTSPEAPTATLSAKSPGGDGFVLEMKQGNGFLVYAWGMTFGVNGEALDVRFDANGNARILGWFTGTLDLGPGVAPLVAGAQRMMLLAELTGTNGAPIWNRGWIYPSTITFVQLAVAPAGDSFVGGYLETGPFDLGTGPLIQPTDAAGAPWAGRFAP